MSTCVRRRNVAFMVLVMTICGLLPGCGVDPGVVGFALLGYGGLPDDPAMRTQLVGGNDKLLVFVQLKGPRDAFLRVQEPGFDPVAAGVSTEVTVVGVAGGVLQRFELPFAHEWAASDGRWVVLDDSWGRVYAVDLNSGGTDNVFVAPDGAVSTQILGLDAGRLLAQTYVRGATEGWVVSVLDLTTGERTDLRSEYELSGAINGDRVALLFDSAVPVPVPLDTGQIALGSGGPPDVTDRQTRIDLIDLADGSSDTIASGATALNNVAVFGERVTWQESSLPLVLDPSIPQDDHVVLHAYDVQTAQTTTVLEFTNSANSQPPYDYTTVGAVGEAGVVVSHQLTTSTSPTAPQHYREDLQGWDGRTTMIQEYDQTPRKIAWYATSPAIIGQRVVYREPFTGEWFVYDASSQERTSLGRF
jgi:hypothetical protein